MSKYTYGIDIGGTTIKCGVFESKTGSPDDYELIFKDEITTRKEEGGSRILDDIADFIRSDMSRRELNKSDITGVGLGVPGSCMPDGTVNKCINIGWGVINAKKLLEEKINLPVYIGNDANVAALGEYWKGAGSDVSSAVFITLGTGVGGGAVVDGKMMVGYNGAACEIGHMPIVDDDNIEDTCNCGKRGCLELVASATGIVRVANMMLNKSDTPSSLREAPYMSAKVVFDEAKAGDGLAIEVTEYVAKYLGKGAACIAAMYDPEVFIIGGGVSAAGDYLTNLIGKYYKEMVFHPSKNTRFMIASLGNDAGVYGAAYLSINP